MHTGYRAFSREVLLTVPFLRNSLDFAFDSEMLMQASHFGFRFAEVPVRTRYSDDASSVRSARARSYAVKTLWFGVAPDAPPARNRASRKLQPDMRYTSRR